MLQNVGSQNGCPWKNPTRLPEKRFLKALLPLDVLPDCCCYRLRMGEIQSHMHETLFAKLSKMQYLRQTARSGFIKRRCLLHYGVQLRWYLSLPLQEMQISESLHLTLPIVTDAFLKCSLFLRKKNSFSASTGQTAFVWHDCGEWRRIFFWDKLFMRKANATTILQTLYFLWHTLFHDIFEKSSYSPFCSLSFSKGTFQYKGKCQLLLE